MAASPLIADRFVLERPAGAGGMGVVYRALDRRTGAAVALKLATRDQDRHLRDRALAEADALATFDHPAVVRLVAHGLTSEGAPFLAMEWLEGEDLAARLACAPLNARAALRLGARVADALAAVHARGVAVWAAHADELAAGSPFALLGAALQRAAGAHPGGGPPWGPPSQPLY